MESQKPQQVGRLIWDPRAGIVADGAVQYLVMRADSLMQLFATLPVEIRAVALLALERSVYDNGMKSLSRYLGERSGQVDGLAAMVEGVSAQLGWGRWALRRAPDGWHLVVRNSPFAAGYGTAGVTVCAPIVGMFGALSECLLGTPCHVVEVCCVAAGASECRFLATGQPQKQNAAQGANPHAGTME